jgi:hypothetical protein
MPNHSGHLLANENLPSTAMNYFHREAPLLRETPLR